MGSNYEFIMRTFICLSMLYSGLTSYRKASWISTHPGGVPSPVFPENPALPCSASGHFAHQVVI